MIDNPDKKNKPRHAGKTLGEVALAIGLVPVFLAALAGVGHFFAAPQKSPVRTENYILAMKSPFSDDAAQISSSN